MSDEPAGGGFAQRLGQRLSSFLRQPGISGMTVVIGVKAGMVLLNFALITLAAWALNADDFGHYSILLSGAGLLYIVAAGGQEPFVLRIWNEMAAAGDGARLKGALRFTTVVALTGSVIVAIGFVPWATSIVDRASALTAVAYLLVAASLQICMHLVRTEVGVASGDGAGNALCYLPPILYLAWHLHTGAPVAISDVFLALACGAAAGLALQLAIIRHRLYRLFPDFSRLTPVYDLRAWAPRSFKLWIATSLEAINQYIDVIIIGYLLHPAIAGAYFVVVRLANLFAAAADAINLFATSRLPGLYYRGEHGALNSLLDTLAWLTLIFILGGMLVIGAGGYFVLQLIDAEYTAYFPELLVLCLGTAALATTRSTTILLMLSGHEGRYLSIVAMSVILRVAGFMLLVPHFGVMGAVSATALSFAIQSLVLRYAAMNSAHIDSSMFRLLKLRRGAQATP